ncbi:hypothetical protein H5410_010766 [Solanum commersonii]|uniref:Uncharacterized protein n=1 Tax=Solanum commersonii TaxID=4109 RepID=A0A9J6AMG5_SOLCO|nr:hypothetical protein H5410_010766 [Solanum commersonii]
MELSPNYRIPLFFTIPHRTTLFYFLSSVLYKMKSWRFSSIYVQSNMFPVKLKNCCLPRHWRWVYEFLGEVPFFLSFFCVSKEN